ncbi:MAG TPA: NAD(P)H-dependent oxidoreductase subunit E [Myxococcaceae bacterium]|nr:NAD(P)H-dependent oxidoreductase subunit E [Myxococcaceae bacterium]
MADTAPAVKNVKDNRARLFERAMSRQGYAPDALIEVLHTAQELFGFLSTDRLREVSRKLRLPPSRVLGVATFYNFFSLQPKAEHTALVCTGTACYVAGAKGLLDAAQRRCQQAEARGRSGKLGIQQARCIGSCGLAPLVVLDGRILPKLSVEALEQQLDEVGA